MCVCVRSNDGGPGGEEEQEMMVLSPGTEEEMEVWGYQTSTIKSVLLMLGRYLSRDSPSRVSGALFIPYLVQESTMPNKNLKKAL